MEVKILEAVSEKLEVRNISHILIHTRENTIKVHVLEKYKRYKIKTKSSLDSYQAKEYEVVRSHAEFEWLYNSLFENPNYGGLIIPPGKY